MNKQQLAAKIWESANKMRSKIEANEYKDYILGFIFYKFLSEKEVKYLKANDWTDEYLPELTEEDTETVESIQKNLGYFISYDNLFSTWLAKGSDFSVQDVRDALSAFSRLINPTHKKVFEGVFDTLQTGLSKLGDSASSQSKSISDLIQLIKDIPMDGKQGYDVLGFIYEYLIEKFAANAGKKAGEFYTPHEVSLLMSEIVANHLKDREKIEIFDPTSGSGSLLINIGKSASKYIEGDNKVKYYAQELKQNTYNLTRMNLVMRGIEADNIVTRNGDTLEDDWPYFDENDPTGTYNPLYVDAVVSNPPYSQAWNPTDKETDPRYAGYGLAPKGKADYAFLLHDLYHIKPDGIMTIVLPHGVLFRGGEEGEIRKNLIEKNKIDTIIGLPANIFYGTGIPTIIMVLKQKRSNTDVLIVDASKGFVKDVRKVVALEKAKAQTEEEAISDPVKSKIYYKYMDSSKVGMVGHFDEKGDYIKGIEDFIPSVQYMTEEHTKTVVKDILENWITLSHNSKFHAIFATSSIPEAINYYRLFKEMKPNLKVTALFDPSIDNNGGVQFKEDGLAEIIGDYNEKYSQDFAIPTFAKMKKDIAARLAHKKPYERIANEPEKQIDLLIVVDQMLTGFDSKWINTLYMDKVLQYENIIQAFSRTNRLFGPDKPFGTIRYYRKPHTMERNVNAAVKLYSGDRPLGLFVQHLVENLKQMNRLYESISDLFHNAGIENFEKLPDDVSACRKFAKDFNEFNEYLEAAKIQGFKWNVSSYVDESTGEVIDVTIDENTYLILALRYKELTGGGGGTDGGDDVPYDLVGYITEIDTGLIDSDYMNSRFDKYIKLLNAEGTTQEAIEQAETELHKTFATLSQEEQKYANIFLHDIQRGDVIVEEGKSLRDYINEYLYKARNDQIHRIAIALGINENLLRNIMSLKLNENNLNEFGRYDELKKTVDKAVAKNYFEKIEGTKIIPPKVNVKVDKLLRDFIISGGYEIPMPTDAE